MAESEDLYNTRELTPAELVSMGLLPAGPLAPAIQSTNPEQNLANMREMVNPPPQPMLPPSPLNPVGFEAGTYTKALDDPSQVMKLLEPQSGTGRVLRDLAGSVAVNQALPGAGVVPSLLRVGGQAALGGGEAAVEGRSPTAIATATGLGAAGQGAGELLAPAVKGPMLQQAGRLAEDSNAALKKTFLRDLADTKARNEAAKLGFRAKSQEIAEKNLVGAAYHTGIQRQWIEQRAGQFMDALKQDIPEFDALPKGSEGIKEFMFGKGYNILHDGYDNAIQDLVGQAKGMTIDISPETAAVFGIKSTGAELSPKVRELLRAAGKEVPAAGFDAAQAITAITGKWKKNPEAYREVADALTDAGLVNPMAEKYKTAIGLQTFIEKSGALKDTGVMDPAKLQQALYTVPKVQELQRRGLGDVSEGKIKLFANAPGPFKETPMPVKPIPEATPRAPVGTEVTYGPGSSPLRHLATFSVPTYAAHHMGMPYPVAAGIGLGTAALANKLLPAGKRVIAAPLSDRQMELLRLLPMMGGAAGATGAREVGGFLGNLE